jgi:ATP-dependent DNA ligase
MATALAFKSGKEVHLVSPSRNRFDSNYPQLVDAPKTLSAKAVIINGKITALDKDGRFSFQLLQNHGADPKTPLDRSAGPRSHAEASTEDVSLASVTRRVLQ